MIKGQENLIPFSERTPEERRELGAKGGRATQAALRRARSMQEAANVLLSAPLQEEDAAIAAALRLLGLEADHQGAILLAAIRQAMRGDIESARFARDTSGQAPSQAVQIGRMSDEQLTKEALGKLSTEELLAMIQQADEQPAAAETPQDSG